MAGTARRKNADAEARRWGTIYIQNSSWIPFVPVLQPNLIKSFGKASFGEEFLFEFAELLVQQVAGLVN